MPRPPPLSKTLPPNQPLATDLNKPKSARNAEKRRSRHIQAEESRPEDKKLMNRTDIDVAGKKIITTKTFGKLEAEIRLFCEFLQEKENRTDGSLFFTYGGPVPDRLTVHRFLLWLTDVCVGVMWRQTAGETTKTTKVCVRTIQNHLYCLDTALKYFNQGRDHEEIQGSIRWVQNELARDANLNLDRKPRYAAHFQDIVRIIECIWSWDAVRLMRDIHSMFNLTLMLNILVDGSGRIGELLPSDKSSIKEKHYLTWEHVQIWLFPANPEMADPVRVDAKLTIKWVKGKTFKSGHYKGVSTRLLPPHMAFQDTTRLLVVLGLYQKVFEHVNSWNDIMNCRTRKNGSVLRIKDEALDRPVFTRGMGHIMDDEDHQFKTIDGSVRSGAAWTYGDATKVFGGLSRIAGLARSFSVTSLRRGDAFLLDKHCAREDETRRLMGQKPGSRAFLEYMPDVGTKDIQAIARGLPEAPNEQLVKYTSISLGACSDAPMELPQAEMEKVDSHPEYVHVLQELADCDRQINERFTDRRELRQAVMAGDPHANDLQQEHMRLTFLKYSRWKSLAEVAFREYRAERIKDLQAAKPEAQQEADEDGDTDKANDALLNETLQKAGSGSLEDFEDIADEEKVYHSTLDEVRRVIQNVSLDDPAPPIDGDLTMDNEPHLDVAFRRTGDLRSDTAGLTASSAGRSGRQLKLQSFSTAYSSLSQTYKQISSAPGPVDGDFVMDKLLNLIGSDFRIGDMPPQWVNRQDSSRCLICHKTLPTDTKCSAIVHVRNCLDQRADEWSTAAYATYIESTIGDRESCGFTSAIRRGCSFKMSETVSADDLQKHMMKHTASQTCSFNGCHEVFPDRATQFEHMYREHGLIMDSIGKKSMYFWCEFCKDHIRYSQRSKECQDHFRDHYDEAFHGIQVYGYEGIALGGATKVLKRQVIIPGLCIICLHNGQIRWHERFVSYDSSCMADHVGRHLRALKTICHRGEDADLTCPGLKGGTCSYPGLMTAQQLYEHIGAVHYPTWSFNQGNSPDHDQRRPPSAKRQTGPPKFTEARFLSIPQLQDENPDTIIDGFTTSEMQASEAGTSGGKLVYDDDKDSDELVYDDNEDNEDDGEFVHDNDADEEPVLRTRRRSSKRKVITVLSDSDADEENHDQMLDHRISQTVRKKVAIETQGLVRNGQDSTESGENSRFFGRDVTNMTGPDTTEKKKTRPKRGTGS